MHPRLTDYIYILASIAFTVYGQLVMKWRVNLYGQLPLDALEKAKFIVTVLLDPWILSSFFAAFIASLAWIGAMTKFELVQAYPFMSLNFVFVCILSGIILSEPLTIQKTLGIMLIVIGTVVLTRG